jgi:hypothetical protein
MSEPRSPAAEGVGMDAVTEAHARFEPFVGTFKADVFTYMGPDQKPHHSTGVMKNALDLGGRYLHQSYTGDAAGSFPRFEGRGYWGFNATSGKYEGFWIDSVSPFMQTEAGDVDAAGKVWTMIGEMTNPQTGQPMRKRSVITLVDRDHHTIDMYFSTPDGGELKAMTIRYARKA